MAAFPPQNYDKYRWTSPQLDTTKFQRYAAGSELFTDLERRNNHGQYSMFLGIEVSLASAEGPNHVLRLARHAWMTLRHSIPTMAAWTELDAAGDTLIVYRVASGPDEVHSWAERTVQLVTHSVDDVRNQLLDHLIPADSHDQTLLHIIPNTTSSREYTLIFSVNHTLFDSTGHKALTHHFLSALARYVGTKGQAEKEVSALKWGEEGANLLPPCTDILAETEPTHGPGYDQTLGGILQDVASTSPRTHQYLRRPTQGGPVTSRRVQHKFTVDQTTRIIQYAKSKGFTVNHLVHAAVYLSSLSDNPSVAEDGVFSCLGSINTRGRLRAPFNGAHAYPGLCMSVSPITVPISVAQGLQGTAQLDAVAAVVKQEYIRQKAYPALLSAISQIADMMVAAMKTRPPLDMTASSYVADGVVERDLDRAYSDQSGTETISVAEYWYSVRQVSRGQNFRGYSWRDQLVVSADYNESATPREAVEGYMRDIVHNLSL